MTWNNSCVKGDSIEFFYIEVNGGERSFSVLDFRLKTNNKILFDWFKKMTDDLS